jgi:hypothetical protein
MTDAGGIVLALAPAAALGANVLCQVLICRLRGGRGLLRSIFAGCALGAAALAAIDLLARGSAGRAVLGGLTYLALSYGYFHFVNLGETARRIRLLGELRDAPGGLTYEELQVRYGARAMTRVRIERLLASGQIVERGGRYTIGRPVVLTMARLVRLAKLVVLGRASE